MIRLRLVLNLMIARRLRQGEISADRAARLRRAIRSDEALRDLAWALLAEAVATGAVGPAMIDEIAPDLHIPFTVMGGIKAHNIAEVLRRGARHVAVVTAVTAAPDVAAAAAELDELVRSAHPA